MAQEDSGEETTLSQLESDDPVQVAKDSAVEIDEPRETMGSKAPEDDLATELAMVTSAEQEEKLSLESSRPLPEASDKALDEASDEASGEASEETSEEASAKTSEEASEEASYLRTRGAISLSDPDLKFAAST